MELAFSFWKRGRIDDWERQFITYYQRYFSLIGKWYSVRYETLATNPSEKLRTLCQLAGINYFPGKEKYWDGTFHTLFGNISALIHLHDKKSSDYLNQRAYLEKEKEASAVSQLTEVKHYKTIYYDPNHKRQLPREVQDSVLNARGLKNIVRMLELSELSNSNSNEELLLRKKDFKRGPVVLWCYFERIRSQLRTFRRSLSGNINNG